MIGRSFPRFEFDDPLPEVEPPTRRSTSPQWHVRYVILDEVRTAIAESLRLREKYRGDGIVVYEVPSDEEAASRHASDG